MDVSGVSTKLKTQSLQILYVIIYYSKLSSFSAFEVSYFQILASSSIGLVGR